MIDCKEYYNKETIRKRGVRKDKGLWEEMVISRRYAPRITDHTLRWSMSSGTQRFIMKF